MGISGFVLHPLFIGPLVLVLNTAAYTAEISMVRCAPCHAGPSRRRAPMA